MPKKKVMLEVDRNELFEVLSTSPAPDAAAEALGKILLTALLAKADMATLINLAAAGITIDYID